MEEGIKKMECPKFCEEFMKRAPIDSNWSLKRYEKSLIHGFERGKFFVTILREYVNLKIVKILDVGCGEGFISSEIAKVCSDVTGIDLDEVKLNLARLRAEEEKISVVYENANAYNLPFMTETFDVVICSYLIEHVDSHEKLINEIHRVLKKGGILFLAGPNKLWPIESHVHLPFLQFLPKKWQNKSVRFFKRGDSCLYINYPTYFGIISILHKCNFNIENITYKHISNNILQSYLKHKKLMDFLSIFTPGWLLVCKK